jgi:hypothetical protein
VTLEPPSDGGDDVGRASGDRGELRDVVVLDLIVLETRGASRCATSSSPW